MPQTLTQVTAATLAALNAAVNELSKSVPAPSQVVVASGHLAYRYKEHSLRQAIVLKVVRLASATRAMSLLIASGLPLDAGASMRIMDDVGGDIQFLCGPIVRNRDPEPMHGKFLKEFFQEEFDHADVTKSTQKRDRVSRKNIRSYIARTFHAENVSRVVDVLETIDNAHSGFIHGASVHVLDVYDGRRFCYQLMRGDEPLDALIAQAPNYLHRALMDANMACIANGCDAVAAEIYALIKRTFADTGEVL